MQIADKRQFANPLILAVALLLVTMVLHPTGGSIDFIQKISTMLMITHSLAVLSIPFWVLGFWGLHKYLRDTSLLSVLAFIIICIGLIAATIAAIVNGLVLPIFLNHYLGAPIEKITAIKPLVNYNTALNHAFDFVYIGASCLSTLLWSVAILRTKRFSQWIGWFGIAFPILVIVPMCLGFSYTNLSGFRLFIVVYVIWIMLIIISIYSQTPVQNNSRISPR